MIIRRASTCNLVRWMLAGGRGEADEDLNSPESLAPYATACLEVERASGWRGEQRRQELRPFVYALYAAAVHAALSVAYYGLSSSPTAAELPSG